MVCCYQLAMDDKWGDWRPHLAMILSNQSSKPDLDRKSIIILGDTLGECGFGWWLVGSSFESVHQIQSCMIDGCLDHVKKIFE